MKAGRKAETKVDAPRAWECFVVGESECDTTEDGQEVLFRPLEGHKGRAFPVRLSFTAKIRPLNLERRHGRWCLAFLFEGPEEEESPVLAVECGEGGPLSLEEAAQLFFGGEAAK